ncbi:hypothetical protein CDD83_5231 [Cordyceps sp. RAO-2017]|nr:hypothetical protein CDD83_5231 [Cordyceps sp. RAO-2017]
MDPLFQEGVVRVELSQLVAEDFVPYGVRNITDLSRLLNSPDYILDVRVTSKTRDAMIGTFGWSSGRLLDSQEAPFIPSVTVYCSATTDAIRAAADAIGSTQKCRVRLHCIPRESGLSVPAPHTDEKAAKPQLISDGDVFRNVRHYMAERRYLVADAWLDKLSSCKRKIMQLVMRRKPIMDVMDGMLPFSGLWTGLEIGNWAKHLAAHDDDLIINYWNHMRSQWTTITEGLESKRHLIDYPSVQRLHRRVPAVCLGDQRQIEADLADTRNPLFPEITTTEDRSRLQRNILSISVMIPSIDTFHDNMRYLTIAAKILEKHIQTQAQRVTTSTGSRVSLFESLRADWTYSPLIQTGHRSYRRVPHTTARLAYAQLFIAALRYFPFLSLETPLQATGGDCVGAQTNDRYLGLLCKTAKVLGFSNSKVDEGCRKEADNEPLIVSES